MRAPIAHRAVPQRLLLRAIPPVLSRRFDAGAAGDLEATFELRIRDRSSGDSHRYSLTVSGGGCEVSRGAATDPGAGVSIGADDVLRLARGGVSWPELLSSGALELWGDPFLALRFPVLFKLPASPT